MDHTDKKIECPRCGLKLFYPNFYINCLAVEMECSFCMELKEVELSKEESKDILVIKKRVAEVFDKFDKYAGKFIKKGGNTDLRQYKIFNSFDFMCWRLIGEKIILRLSRPAPVPVEQGSE